MTFSQTYLHSRKTVVICIHCKIEIITLVKSPERLLNPGCIPLVIRTNCKFYLTIIWWSLSSWYCEGDLEVSPPPTDTFTFLSHTWPLCKEHPPPSSGGDAKPWGPKFESRQINPDFNVLCHLSNIGSGYTLCRGDIPAMAHPSASDSRQC